MTFELLCMGLIALAFGLAVAFGGYKLLWVILPIWGFFAGLALGAQTVQVVFWRRLLGDYHQLGGRLRGRSHLRRTVLSLLLHSRGLAFGGLRLCAGRRHSHVDRSGL